MDRASSLGQDAITTNSFVLTTTKIVVDIPRKQPAGEAVLKTSHRKPTNAELAILRVIWVRGPSTVRQITEIIGGDTGYTTVLKLLQIMTEKQLVRRDESQRTHVYETAYSEDETQRALVSDLLDRAFGGSAAKLVLQALDSGKTSPEELAEIRRLLDAKRGGQR